MSFPRYPEYKPSGVECLGDVPEEWEVARLKNVIAQNITDGPHTTPTFHSDGIPFLSVDGIQDGELQFDGCRFISKEDHEEFRKKALPRKGDLLLGKAASTGKLARVKVDFEFSIWSPLALIRLTKTKANPAFFEQWLKSPIAQAQIDNLCTSNTQKNISMDDIPRLIVTIPPLPEQTAIAEFLDRETGKIDGLVAEQRRLMELLKEKRQAVISHAVTKGLNPHAPMKPSGIEWLGDVPEHWRVKRLKHNARLLTEKTDRRDHPVGLENIEGWSGRFIPTETAFEGEGIAFDAGDILFGKLRPYLAKAYLAQSSGEAVGDFHVMRPAVGIEARFAQYQILNREFIAIVDGSTFGSKMPRASWEFVGGMKVTLPPLAEQTAIAEFLDAELAKFDALTAEAQRAIDLLQERRTALISAAVTGQIDVRQPPKN